jgi:hypothetical protein
MWVCIHVVQIPTETRGIGSSGVGVIGGCELPETNSGPLEELSHFFSPSSHTLNNQEGKLHSCSKNSPASGTKAQSTGLCAAHTVSQQQVCSLDPYQIYPGVTRPSTSQCYVVCCLSLGQARPISGACSGFLIAPQARAHFPEHHGLPEGGV